MLLKVSAEKKKAQFFGNGMSLRLTKKNKTEFII